MASYPGERAWWPWWNGGMPYENAYLPFSHWLTAAFHSLTGLSAARAFHVVSTAYYTLAAPALFWMAWRLSRRLAPSFAAGLLYSVLSLVAAVAPPIAADMDGVRNLRRLHVLAFRGEAPHTLALALLPAAAVCFHRALRGGGARWRILAGVAASAAALTSAFGVTALGAALLAWLLAYRTAPWWKAPLAAAAIGAVAWCACSPWISPGLIRAIRENAPAAGGDYRYRPETWAAVAIAAAGYLALGRLLERWRAPEYWRFFALLGYPFAAALLAWYGRGVALVPQPERLQLELEMSLALVAAFGGAALGRRLPEGARLVAGAALGVALVLQAGHGIAYSRCLVRPVDVTRLSEYKAERWLAANLPGERVFLAGSASLLFNAFAGNQQMRGRHEQHTVNSFIPVAGFTIVSGMNAGARDAEYSTFWLKTFGLRAIHVPGSESTERYQPVANPRKFEGVLRELWREGGDAVFEVPGRSRSLAHVVPVSATPSRRPVHGLDVEPAAAYVAALDGPNLPPATFRWISPGEAQIRADAAPGQVISVQVTCAPGWEARAEGRPLRVRGDAIGQLAIEPGRAGPCEIALRYTGGAETTLTRGLSAAALLAAAAYAWRGRRLKASVLPAPL